MTLSEFEINKKGVILEVLDGPVTTKLFEFGVLPGVDFMILNKASFKGPIFVMLGTNRIMLRRAEADAILVK